MQIRVRLNRSSAEFIQQKIRSGEYLNPSHVINAALATLMQQPELYFAPGDLERAIAEGEASAREHGWIDAKQALRKRRQRRAARLHSQQKSANHKPRK